VGDLLVPEQICHKNKKSLLMNRTASASAKILSVEIPQIKNWAVLFKDYLQGAANPKKGVPRLFSDSDLLVLSYVARYWEEQPDLENIRTGLNRDEHLEVAEFRERIYLNSPILQEPPDGLDETWRHGILLNGGGHLQFLELARNYRHAAELLLDEALKSGESNDWACPVLFAYRHTLELYLKIIGEVDEATHSLARCIHFVEDRHSAKMNPQIKGWIQELEKIDPHPGTAFRYADDDAQTLRYAEYWIDFVQFKFAMEKVFDMLDRAVIDPPRAGGRPSVPTRTEQPKRKTSPASKTAK
jgi:hypothetical protein